MERKTDQIAIDDAGRGVLRQEGATSNGPIIDFNDPAQTGGGHWLAEHRRRRKTERNDRAKK